MVTVTRVVAVVAVVAVTGVVVMVVVHEILRIPAWGMSSIPLRGIPRSRHDGPCAPRNGEEEESEPLSVFG